MEEERPPAWVAAFSRTRLGRTLRGLDDKAMRDKGTFERRVRAATILGGVALVTAKLFGGLRSGQGVVLALVGAVLAGLLVLYAVSRKSQ